MKPESSKKPITKMTAAELARETAEFDREFIEETFTEPSSAERERFDRAARKRGPADRNATQ